LRKIKIRIKTNDFLHSDKSQSCFIQAGALSDKLNVPLVDAYFL